MNTPEKLNWFERAISVISPRTAVERMRYRMAASYLNTTQRKYDAASSSRRTSGWNAPGTSATSEVQLALQFLRNRSREMVRNNAYAENAVREIANNMVGTGIIPKPLNLKKNADKRIRQIWKEWADSTDCDYDGHLNYYGIQNLAARTIVESGEVIIRKHIVQGTSFPLQLQVLEPDFIDTTKYVTSLVGGGYVLYGVEFNSSNKIVAYWLWDHHPGDNMRFAIKSNRVPADEIIHVFEKKRPGQFRGVPFGHASMLRLRDLDEYEDAQLIRQKIAACFSVFITDNEPSAAMGGAAPSLPPLEKVEPGIIEHLPSGKTVTMASPPDAGAAYDPYVKSVLRSVSSGYGMDYVTLTGDLTAVNFSSGRMGWLKFHRNISSWQWLMLVPQMCDKTWVWFIQLANVLGYVKELNVKASWTPPRREMIDPVKEVAGIRMAIRTGLTSLQESIRQNGDDPDDVMAELVAMKEMLDANGLMLESDPRFGMASGKQPVKEAAKPAAKDQNTGE